MSNICRATSKMDRKSQNRCTIGGFAHTHTYSFDNVVYIRTIWSSRRRCRSRLHNSYIHRELQLILELGGVFGECECVMRWRELGENANASHTSDCDNAVWCTTITVLRFDYISNKCSYL